MNARDKAFLAKLQDCAGLMLEMNPKNPADVQTKAIYHAALLECSRIVYGAISSHGYGEHDNAIRELGGIKPLLDDAAKRALKAEGRTWLADEAGGGA